MLRITSDRSAGPIFAAHPEPVTDSVRRSALSFFMSQESAIEPRSSHGNILHDARQRVNIFFRKAPPFYLGTNIIEAEFMQ